MEMEISNSVLLLTTAPEMPAHIGVRLAKVEGMLGRCLESTLEESLRLTATEGMDWKGKER